MRYKGKVYRPPSEAYSLIVQVTYGVQPQPLRLLRYVRRQALCYAAYGGDPGGLRAGPPGV